MKIEKPSLLIAAGAWVCVLVLSWQMVMRLIALDFLTWFFFIFFFVIALISSSVYSGGGQKKRGLVEVNFKGTLYSEDAGNVKVVENRDRLFIFISETTPVAPPRPEPAPTEKPINPFEHSVKISSGSKKQ